MHNGESGSKRKTAVSETDVPAKRAAHVVVPAALLRTVAASLHAAMLDVMNVPCANVAARGRAVAAMDDCKRQLNDFLGIKRRGASVLAISDVILDVFQCLRRQELDTLQIVSVHFNAIIEKKLTLVCLRMLVSAKLSPSNNLFELVIHEVGAKETTHFPTGVDDDVAATALLLKACQSSRVDELALYETMRSRDKFFDFLALRAPTIFVTEFYMRRRPLSGDVADGKVLRALQAFAELRMVQAEMGTEPKLLGCLIRTCFKAGARMIMGGPVFIKECDAIIVEDSLLEFCFGACDEQHEERRRFLTLNFKKTLKSDFLQRWIERAESTDCRHDLYLKITFWHQLLPQVIAALDDYKRDGHTEQETRLGSVSGRNWTATYSDYGRVETNHITFEINH